MSNLDDIEYVPLTYVKPKLELAPKLQDRITSFNPLPSGWVNVYEVSGQELLRPCPGILEVKTYNLANGRNELLDVSYVAAVFDDGLLIEAATLDGYLETKLKECK